MIFYRAHGKDRHPDIRNMYRTAINLEPTLGKVVVEIELAQVFRMHSIRHACRVGVPGHKIIHLGAFSHQVFAHNPRPDQIVRAQHLEGAGHLRGIKIALLPHHAVKERELAFVYEQRQFARFGEIDLTGQQ